MSLFVYKFNLFSDFYIYPIINIQYLFKYTSKNDSFRYIPFLSKSLHYNDFIIKDFEINGYF